MSQQSLVDGGANINITNDITDLTDVQAITPFPISVAVNKDNNLSSSCTHVGMLPLNVGMHPGLEPVSRAHAGALMPSAQHSALGRAYERRLGASRRGMPARAGARVRMQPTVKVAKGSRERFAQPRRRQGQRWSLSVAVQPSSRRLGGREVGARVGE